MILLMTATVQPHVPGIVARSDVAVRLNDYAAALSYWTANPPAQVAGIVFVENSQADISALEQIARSSPVPVEFLRYSPVPIPDGVHYGHGELQSIDHAVRASSLLQQPTGDLFVKVTGRLVFPRVPALLARVGPADQAVVDARWGLASLLHLGRPRRTVSTQLMVFRTDFYRRFLLGGAEWLRPEEGYTHAENYFFETLTALSRTEKGVRLAFPVTVWPSGVGGNGRRYDTARRRLAERLRTVVNRVVLRA